MLELAAQRSRGQSAASPKVSSSRSTATTRCRSPHPDSWPMPCTTPRSLPA